MKASSYSVDLSATKPKNSPRHYALLWWCLLSSMAIAYWSYFASDRYISEAHIIIQSTDINSGQSMDFGSLLTGMNTSNSSDQMLLRDRLLSMDMLAILESQLHLRQHYANPNMDKIARMWSETVPQEWFYDYYRSHISVEFDSYDGVLVIQSEAFDAKTAYQITRLLVAEGERTMNEMAHRLAREQLRFIEKQVTQAADKFQQARIAVLTYQNRKGLVSPQDTAATLAGTINQLKAQQTTLQAQRTALLGYLSPQAPGVIDLDLQLNAIAQQIRREESRLAAPKGNALNTTVEEFERLQLAAGFAQDVYKTALIALERSRMEATRTVKKVSILQSPTFPEYPLRPRRIYNITVFMVLSSLGIGIIRLLAAITRDHQD